jgi:hypothetical protein
VIRPAEAVRFAPDPPGVPVSHGVIRPAEAVRFAPDPPGVPAPPGSLRREYDHETPRMRSAWQSVTSIPRSCAPTRRVVEPVRNHLDLRDFPLNQGAYRCVAFFPTQKRNPHRCTVARSLMRLATRGVNPLRDVYPQRDDAFQERAVSRMTGGAEADATKVSRPVPNADGKQRNIGPFEGHQTAETRPVSAPAIRTQGRARRWQSVS